MWISITSNNCTTLRTSEQQIDELVDGDDTRIAEVIDRNIKANESANVVVYLYYIDRYIYIYIKCMYVVKYIYRERERDASYIYIYIGVYIYL